MKDVTILVNATDPADMMLEVMIRAGALTAELSSLDVVLNTVLDLSERYDRDTAAKALKLWAKGYRHEELADPAQLYRFMKEEYDYLCG